MTAPAAPRSRAATIVRALLAIAVAIVAVPILAVTLLTSLGGKGH